MLKKVAFPLFSIFWAIGQSGCVPLDSVDMRAETVNRSNADHNNLAQLLNIIRAANFEPLTFTSVSGFVANNSLTGSLGLPSASFGPALALTGLGTGSSSVGGTISNNYNISIQDDHALYAGLGAPLDPMLVASLVQTQGYPRELLFFLAIDHLKVQKGKDVVYLENNPSNEGSNGFGQFGGKLAELLAGGMTVSSVTTQSTSKAGDKSQPQTIQTATICFDRSLPVSSPYANGGVSDNYLPTCADVLSKGVVKPKITDNTYLVTDSRTGERFTFNLRSPFGIYEYLGRFVRNHTGIANAIPSTDTGSESLFTILNRVPPEGCFVSASYEGVFYCVPETATDSKRVFTLLRQIVALNTPVAPPPSNVTVHLSP